MPDDRSKSETAACASLLDGAADELATIRAALEKVSLEAAEKKRAAGKIPKALPLRAKPVSLPPPIPAQPAPEMPLAAPRPTLAERLRAEHLRGALRR